MNKSVVIALFISIIVTNLLLSMNYLNTYNVYEGVDDTLIAGNTPGSPSGTSTGSPSGTSTGSPSGNPPSGNPPSGNPPSGDPPSGNPPSGNPPSGNPTSRRDGSGNPIQESYRNIMGGY